MKQILKDHKFRKGFSISYVKANRYNKDMMVWKFVPGQTVWKICQWGSRFSLVENCTIAASNKHVKHIANEQKSITRNRGGTVTLSIKTDKEYLHDRLHGEEWPHLLLEQFFHGINISKLNNLTVSIDFDFLDFVDHMGERRQDLHTFQVGWYFCVGNKNRKSEGFDDFFWFGLPFIDTPRLPMGKPYEAADLGKEDSTKKYIINIDPHLYIKKNVEVGDNFKVKMDILPYLTKAFEKAKSVGYLTNTKFEDLELVSTNFGIEDTGTFDGTIRLNSIDIVEE